MADNTLPVANSTVATVATTSTPVHQPLSESKFTGTDVVWFLGTIVLVLSLYAGIRNLFKDRKKEEKEEAEERAESLRKAIVEKQDDIKNRLTQFTDDFGKRLIKLEDKSVEFMPRNEIIGSIEHEKNNRVQALNIVNEYNKRNDDEIKMLRERTTTLEEKSRTHENVIGEIKNLIREKMEETKQLIKDRGELTDEKISMLEKSVREISTRSPKQ